MSLKNFSFYDQVMLKKPFNSWYSGCSNVHHSKGIIVNFSTCRRISSKCVKVKKDNRPASVPSTSHRTLFESIKSKYSTNISRLDELLLEAHHKYRTENVKRLSQMRELVSRIERRICSANSRLVVIGSVANSFLFDETSSDVDVCFFPLLPTEQRSEFNADFQQNHTFREHLMRLIFKQIVNDEEIGGAQLDLDESRVLHRARVPILLIKYKNNLSVDIQFSNEHFQAIRNTNLIRHYAMADGRFELVYMWLRSLFASLGIMRSKEGLFSSYHILCLVAHFLQCTSGGLSECVLPVLTRTHPHLVGADLAIERVIEMLDEPVEERTLKGWSSENRMSAGELGMRLVEYYANVDIFRCAINLEKGTLQRKKQPLSTHWLQIFDPYSKWNVCERKESGDAFQRAIHFIFNRMQNGLLIDSFPQFAEAKEFELKNEWIKWRFLRGNGIKNTNRT